MSKKILFTRKYPDLAAQLLKDAGFAVTLRSDDTPMTPHELIDAAKNHHAVLSTTSDKIGVPFLEACNHLDIISQFAVGFDNVAVDKATELGIAIGNTPDVLNDATADIAFVLMLATSRLMFHNHKKIINGKWGSFSPTGDLGIEIKNKTLGIYGLGRIGIEMAKKCKAAYRMNIVYHNRRPNPKAEHELGATYVDFDGLLAQSDVISLHCSLNESTSGVFDKVAFKKMKQTALFINTSRGAVHNEPDLIDALKNGEIWGAGLDVTDPEPMSPDNELLQMRTVCVLPHIGSATEETRNGMARLAAENIIGFYKNGKVPHIVNPEVLSI